MGNKLSLVINLKPILSRSRVGENVLNPQMYWEKEVDPCQMTGSSHILPKNKNSQENVRSEMRKVQKWHNWKIWYAKWKIHWQACQNKTAVEERISELKDERHNTPNNNRWWKNTSKYVNRQNRTLVSFNRNNIRIIASQSIKKKNPLKKKQSKTSLLRSSESWTVHLTT